MNRIFPLLSGMFASVTLLIAGAEAAFLGARLTSLYVPRVKELFGILIAIVTAYKIYTLF